MRLGPLLSGPKQFVVPYFQRAYSWRRHQWNTLFDDILELYELGSASSHFLGSMVLLKDPTGSTDGDESPTLVIDGESFTEMQTRITGAIARMVARHAGRIVVAVSHADPIKAAVAQALGTPLDLFQRIVIAPTSITAVAYRRGGPAVLTVNSLAGDIAWLGGGKA